MATKVTTTVKTAAKARAKSIDTAVAKTSLKKSANKTSIDEPSMRFYHSKALRDKTFALLDEMEAFPGHPQHGDAMADLVTELIEAGMDYYFMRALKQANVGFVVEQSARMGMSGAVKLISSVNRRFIVRMDKSQLLVVAQHIRELC